MFYSSFCILKIIVFFDRLIICQSHFTIVRFKPSQYKLAVFSLLRSKYSDSLLAKTFIALSLFANSLSVEKKKANFVFAYGNAKFSTLKLKPRFKSILVKRICEYVSLNDHSRVTGVSFRDFFSVSLVISDITRAIKRAGLENFYDFFNWPVKFNSVLEISVKNFIILSMYSRKNEK